MHCGPVNVLFYVIQKILNLFEYYQWIVIKVVHPYDLIILHKLKAIYGLDYSLVISSLCVV